MSLGGGFRGRGGGEFAGDPSDRYRSFSDDCRTPGTDRSRTISSSSSRTKRRLKKRRMQRYVKDKLTITFSPAAQVCRPRFRAPKLPVLPPSEFVDDGEAGDWITVCRRRRSPPVQVRSPAMRSGFRGSRFQNLKRSGLVGVGPAKPRLHESPRTKSGYDTRENCSTSISSPTAPNFGLRRLIWFFWQRVSSPSADRCKVMAFHGGGRGGE